uniref:RNA-directed RNA polymerase n=1 Tax=Scaphoideus titanus sobemo-like virus 2 TaxID=2716558 RepID=A0A6G7NRW5_9VIRU|nr:RNA-directed RNA polymerase [Scaphoideus titanus sobemo-like virus 2]
MEIEYEPARWRIPDDFLSFEHFRRVIDGMDMSSTPGYPYQLSIPTNGMFLGSNGDGTFCESRLRAVYEIVLRQISEREADPIRLFIKQEPHKASKVEKEAWRLISSVSVVDQIIDHLLFDPMNHKLAQNYLYVVPQIGWAPLYLGWALIPSSGVAMDKSGWDWSVRPWLAEVVLALRKRLCDNLTPEWEELASWRYQMLFGNPVYVTTGGRFFRQKQPGVMKSGCVNTISDNSIMQDVLNKVVELETGLTSSWMRTMGDDTLQSDPGDVPTYVSTLSKYCIVKDVKYAVEFAGYRFGMKNIDPLYFQKHCWQLLHADPRYGDDIAISYSILYHRSKKGPLIKSLARYIGRVPSDSWLDAIWDGNA